MGPVALFAKKQLPAHRPQFVIMKPASDDPLTVLMLSEQCQTACREMLSRLFTARRYGGQLADRRTQNRGGNIYRKVRK
jgi:hypothetical protein